MTQSKVLREQGIVESKTKDVRFIDSHYNTILTVPNNSYVLYKGAIKKVSRIDDYHFYVGYIGYHICEFGEHLEREHEIVVPINTEVAELILQCSDAHDILHISMSENTWLYYCTDGDQAHIFLTKNGELVVHDQISLVFDSYATPVHFYINTLYICDSTYLQKLQDEPLQLRIFAHKCLEIITSRNRF